MKTLVEQATKEGSLYVHDIELGKLIKEGNDFRLNANRLDAISQPLAGPAGGGGSTVMITHAPSTSNIANTKVETAAGVSDPHTQLAGVY